MVKTITRQRRDYNRAIFLCLILISIISAFIDREASMLYLFVRRKFQWSLRKYTLFTSCVSVISMLGTIFSTYVLNKKLKIPEATLMLIGLFALLNGSVLYGLASNDWYMYVGKNLQVNQLFLYDANFVIYYYKNIKKKSSNSTMLIN